MTQNLLFNIGEMFKGLWEQMGIANGVWQNYVMLLISFVLFYLAIVKKFEPLLLLPIAFGMFIVNVPGAYDIVWGTYPEDITTAETFIEARGILPVGYYFADGKLLFENVWATQEGFLAAGGVLPEGASIVEGVVHFAHTYDAVQNRGLLWYLFYGVDKVIYPAAYLPRHRRDDRFRSADFQPEEHVYRRGGAARYFRGVIPCDLPRFRPCRGLLDCDYRRRGRTYGDLRYAVDV